MAAYKTTFIILILSAMAYGTEEEGSDKVLICNIQLYSTFGGVVGNFTPEDLDPNLCTHIVYNKAKLDVVHRDIIPSNPSMDLYDNGGKGMFNRTMKLKEANPKLKVILQLCCEADTFWDNTTMPHDLIIPTFVKNAVLFLEGHGFDGLYITLLDHPEEPRLLTALREEFDKRGLLLLTFLFSIEKPIYNPIVTRDNVDAFDMVVVHGSWVVNIDSTNIYLDLSTLRKVVSNAQQGGVPKEKIVVVIETFAECYKLCNNSENGISAPICGVEKEMTHSELMYKIKNNVDGWVAQRDEESGMFYGHSDTQQWTTFEDPVSVRAKAQYVLEENLAGIVIMTVDMDDTMGYNEEGEKFLITKAVHNALRGI